MQATGMRVSRRKFAMVDRGTILILDRGHGDERVHCQVRVRQRPGSAATHLFAIVEEVGAGMGSLHRSKFQVAKQVCEPFGDFFFTESVKLE